MSKTYGYRKNAVAAARKELDDTEARAGVHFTITETDGKFSYALIDRAPATCQPLTDHFNASFGRKTAEITDVMLGNAHLDGIPADLFELPACLKREAPTGEEAEAQAARHARYAKEAAGERELVVRKGGVASTPKGEKKPTKIGAVLEKAKTSGITMEEVKAMTGWTKTGGFFGAVKRQGLTLTKEKVGKATVYRAVAA